VELIFNRKKVKYSEIDGSDLSFATAAIAFDIFNQKYHHRLFFRADIIRR
jgi:hypothetical protein